MRDLIHDLIPHAPEHGLYVEPGLPADRVRNALRDYAPNVDEREVVALYDATLLGSAKDGAVFTADRIVFQNNDLQSPQTILYGDIVAVRSDRKLMGGRRVLVDVNRGRSTVEVSIDFSGRPGAAEPVARFLSEAMLRETDEERRMASVESGKVEAETDPEAVRAAIEKLFLDGKLSQGDRERLLRALEG